MRGNVLAGPVQSVTTNVNTEKLNAVRGSLLYQVNEDWSVLSTVYAQNMEMGGYDLYDSPPGPAYMAHYEAFTIPEPISDMVHIYSVNITGNLGFANFTSATSYWNRNNSQTQDASESVGGFSNGIYPYIAVPYSEVDYSKQFSQEIRLASKGDDRLRPPSVPELVPLAAMAAVGFGTEFSRRPAVRWRSGRGDRPASRREDGTSPDSSPTRSPRASRQAMTCARVTSRNSSGRLMPVNSMKSLIAFS